MFKIQIFIFSPIFAIVFLQEEVYVFFFCCFSMKLPFTIISAITFIIPFLRLVMLLAHSFSLPFTLYFTSPWTNTMIHLESTFWWSIMFTWLYSKMPWNSFFIFSCATCLQFLLMTSSTKRLTAATFPIMFIYSSGLTKTSCLLISFRKLYREVGNYVLSWEIQPEPLGCWRGHSRTSKLRWLLKWSSYSGLHILHLWDGPFYNIHGLTI